MKKRLLLVIGVIAFIACLFIIYIRFSAGIGSVRGAEWEYLSYSGSEYVITQDTPVSRSDKGRFLGIATSGDTMFYIFSIKGNRDYLYCTREWEGWIYRRIP